MRCYLSLIALTTVVLSACSTDGNERRDAYLDADYYTRLELPPDLTAPDARNQVTVPKPTDAAIEKFRDDTKDLGKPADATDATSDAVNADAPVLPKLKGVKLETGDGVAWLEVDSDAQKLWPQLSAFWIHEGIRVVSNRPAIGLIETDWVSKLQVDEDASWFKRAFTKLEPDKLDKFRMRIEAEPGSNRSRVYVAHSGMEVDVQGEDINWRTRCSESELEREILSRLALYVGVDESQAKTALANYKPYASRVKIPQDDTSSLYVTGSMEFTWKRSMRALDRLGVSIAQTDMNTRTMDIAIDKLETLAAEAERDEIAESSWLMQWIKSANDASDRQFKLAFTQSDGVTRLQIQTPQGEVAESVLAEQLRKGLAVELQ